MNALCSKFDPEEYERTFTSLMEREKAGTVSNPAGLGTVFDLAKRAGWKHTQHGTAGQMDAGTASNDEGGALGDIKAGRLFAKAMRDKLRFVGPAGRWLKWNGTIWEWCSKGEEMQAAKRVADKILDHVMTLYQADPERHRKALTWAMGLQGIKRLEATLALAQSEEV